MPVIFDISKASVSDPNKVALISADLISNLKYENKGLSDCESYLLGLLICLYNFYDTDIFRIFTHSSQLLSQGLELKHSQFMRAMRDTIDQFNDFYVDERNNTVSVEKLSNFDREKALKEEEQKFKDLSDKMEKLKKELEAQKEKISQLKK